MSEDWEKVLTEFIPRIALAKDSESYQRELMVLIAKVHDGHANLWSSLGVRPPVGKCQLRRRSPYICSTALRCCPRRALRVAGSESCLRNC